MRRLRQWATIGPFDLSGGGQTSHCRRSAITRRTPDYFSAGAAGIHRFRETRESFMGYAVRVRRSGVICENDMFPG